MIATDINKLIKASKDAGELETHEISDGYHTIGELYDHRIALFITLCNLMDYWSDAANDKKTHPVWKSKKHSDGTMYDGWFIAGIGTAKGKQITYHLPIKDWDKLDVPEREMAPEWDGHTPDEVIKRLLNL